jgi:peptidyl-prolyl cis-trans isomerase C
VDINKKSVTLNILTGLTVAVLLQACAKDSTPTLTTQPPAPAPVVETPAMAPPPAASPAGSPDDLVVEVDGVKLVRSELNQHVAQAMAAQGQNLPPQILPQIAQQMSGRIIEGFISETVLGNAANQSDIEITPAEIEEAIADIEETLPPDITLEQAMERAGFTEKILRDRIARDLRVRKLIEQKTAEVPETSEENIVKFYEDSAEQFEMEESVATKHILLQFDEETTDEEKAALKAEAEEVRQQLLEGADFADLAKQHSDCPSAERGGDLGDLVRGRTVQPFEDAAFSQEVDAIGDVVETQFGYHVIVVTNRTAAHKQTLEEVHDDLAEYLKGQEVQKVMQAYVEGLRAEAKVSYGEGFEPPPPPATP